MTALSVRRHGDPASGPLVVLIHGAMDRGATFVPTQRLLAPLPVLVYDRRGYGRSRALPPRVELSVQVDDVMDVAGRDRVVLVGHSFGGLIALGAAVQFPQLVLAVGVYEPPMPWLETWPESFRFDDPDGAAEVFFRAVVGDAAWDGLPEEFRRARRAEGAALMADVETAQRGLPFDWADVLCPVSVAHGSATSPQYVTAAETVAEGVHDARCQVIEGATHGVHLTHPDAYAAWIRGVVDTVRV